MYIDYILFTVIALVTGVLILFRILSSNMKNQEKGFLQLIILAVCHNIIEKKAHVYDENSFKGKRILLAEILKVE